MSWRHNRPRQPSIKIMRQPQLDPMRTLGYLSGMSQEDTWNALNALPDHMDRAEVARLNWTAVGQALTDFVNPDVSNRWTLQDVLNILGKLVKYDVLEGQLCDVNLVSLYRDLRHTLNVAIDSGVPLKLYPLNVSMALHALYVLNPRCLAEHPTCFAQDFLPLALRLLDVHEQLVQIELKKRDDDAIRGTIRSLMKIVRICPIIHDNTSSPHSRGMSSAPNTDVGSLLNHHNRAASTLIELVARHPHLNDEVGSVSRSQSCVAQLVRENLQQHISTTTNVSVVTTKVHEEVDVTKIIGGKTATTPSGLLIPPRVHAVDVYIECLNSSGDVVRRVVIEVDGHVFHHTKNMTQSSKTRLRNAFLQSTLTGVGAECCTFTTSSRDDEMRWNQCAKRIAQAIMDNQALPREVLMSNSLDALNVYVDRFSPLFHNQQHQEGGDQALIESADDESHPKKTTQDDVTGLIARWHEEALCCLQYKEIFQRLQIQYELELLLCEMSDRKAISEKGRVDLDEIREQQFVEMDRISLRTDESSRRVQLRMECCIDVETLCRTAIQEECRLSTRQIRTQRLAALSLVPIQTDETMNRRMVQMERDMELVEIQESLFRTIVDEERRVRTRQIRAQRLTDVECISIQQNEAISREKVEGGLYGELLALQAMVHLPCDCITLR